MDPTVDVVILTRDRSPLEPRVEKGLLDQIRVRIKLHRIIGEPKSTDQSRWQTIARARNEGIAKAQSAWVMFVDDDVALDANCVRRLVDELAGKHVYAAMAADYLGERRGGCPADHVAMGATLFRRSVLKQIRFRWQTNRCECQCCCDDLRRMHWGIDYSRTAVAHHLPKLATRSHAGNETTETEDEAKPTSSPRIFTAFDRNHFRKLTDRFLPSLRAAGNRETVQALAFGLYPSERRRLAGLPGVEAFHRTSDGRSVSRQRMRQFQSMIRRLPPDTPIAYWDAGDVIFQGTLQPLWHLVRQHPDKLLAVREPHQHPENGYVAGGVSRIRDPRARKRAFDLLARRLCLNGGFAAGTAQTLLKYFRTVDRWVHRAELAGSIGDQIALNLYCHSMPDAWHEIDQGWNYCLCGRKSGDVERLAALRYRDKNGTMIRVVHGNGGTLDHVRMRRTGY